MAKPSHHRTAPRLGRAPHAPQPALRNPWLQGSPTTHGPGPGPGSHSSESTTYDGYVPVNDQYAPEPPQSWHHHNFLTPTAPVYEIPEGGGQEPSAVRAASHRNAHLSRPLTPGGLSQVSGNGGVAAGCGECDALDTWCYYCVQGVLGIATLAGLSLLIAYAVLQAQPQKAAASANLSALPYIGAMLALVSGALLLVQLFARDEKKRKRRRIQQLRLQRTSCAGTLRRPASDQVDAIPLQDLQKPPTGPSSLPTIQNTIPVPNSQAHLAYQFQPLLARPTVGQHQQLRHQDVILSPSGTPWWRRQPTHPGRVVYPS